MTGKIAGPTLNIPAGHEHQQREITRRNELAQAMLSQGLRQDDNMISPLQVLGHWAQALAGRSMQKDSDKLQNTLDEQVRNDYSSRMEKLIATMTGGGSDPSQAGMTAAIDPILAGTPLGEVAIDRMKQNMTQGDKFTTFGGRHMRQGDIPLGAYDNKPDSQVWVSPEGRAQLNPLIETLTAIKAGRQVPGDYPVETQMPGAVPAIPSPKVQLIPDRPAGKSDDQLMAEAQDAVARGADKIEVFKQLEAWGVQPKYKVIR